MIFGLQELGSMVKIVIICKYYSVPRVGTLSWFTRPRRGRHLPQCIQKYLSFYFESYFRKLMSEFSKLSNNFQKKQQIFTTPFNRVVLKFQTVKKHHSL